MFLFYLPGKKSYFSEFDFYRNLVIVSDYHLKYITVQILEFHILALYYVCFLKLVTKSQILVLYKSERMDKHFRGLLCLLYINN